MGNLEVYAGQFSTTFGSHGEIYFGQKKSSSKKFSRSIEMKDTIIGLVKGINPQAIEAEAETRLSRNLNEEILEELRRIRKAVERT